MLLVLSIKLKHPLAGPKAPHRLLSIQRYNHSLKVPLSNCWLLQACCTGTWDAEHKTYIPCSLICYLFCSQALWRGTTPSRSICPKNISAAPIISWTTRTQRNNTHPSQRWSAGLVCSEMPGGDQAAGTGTSWKAQIIPLKRNKQTNQNHHTQKYKQTKKPPTSLEGTRTIKNMLQKMPELSVLSDYVLHLSVF